MMKFLAKMAEKYAKSTNTASSNKRIGCIFVHISHCNKNQVCYTKGVIRKEKT